MKKILFTMLALLSVLTINAAKWTAPSSSDFLTSTPIYVQVNVNGQRSTTIEVAAFINGECRASADVYDRTTNLYTLRVWGNPDEAGSTITFKAYDSASDFEFSFTKTAEFTGETNSEVPFVLNIDEPTGVRLTSPIKILAKFPAEKDLSEYITLTYDGHDGFGNAIDYEPLGQSTLETELTYVWTPSDAPEFNAFTIDNKNILTATKSTLLDGEVENTGENAVLTINSNSNLVGYTTIIIDEIYEPVTGISCSLQSVQINKGASLRRNIELLNSIEITPSDATNKGFHFECPDNPDAFVNDVAKLGGTYQVRIVSDDNSEIYTTITVEVYAPVEELSVSQSTIYAAIGDNLTELISPLVTVYPEDATNRDFNIIVPDEASDAFIDYNAVKAGEYLIEITSAEDSQLSQEVNVIVVDIDAPESIDVELGTNAFGQLRELVTIVPDNEAFTIAPADAASLAAFDENGGALTPGTYNLMVASASLDRVYKMVVVNVYTPVDITFPTELTISKYKDTEFELTVTGDGFDPSLVRFELVKSEEPVLFGLPTYTTADNGAGKVWNMRGTGHGNVELRVYYNDEVMPRSGEQVCNITTPVEISLGTNGWDWIYAPDYIELTVFSETGERAYLSNLNIDDNNKVIEIRSQTDLLYNDKNYGFIGSLSTLSSTGMYKVKAVYEDVSNSILTSPEGYWERYPHNPLNPGYTWIGYPNEWNMTLAELNDMLSYSNNIPSEGDQIIGKTNFAEYDGTKWVGSDFILEAGKGYIYYNSSTETNRLGFDYTPDFSSQTYSRRLLSENQPARSNSSEVWEYDATQFADNMAIVAEIENLENPEDYTIGAFVGDECRGMGKVVKDGKMMINVAGQSGEIVSFRLHNENTGEFIPLETEVHYSQRLGSLKSPKIMTAPKLSGISEIITDENDEETYYDLYGRKIEGNPSAGIYIVKTVKNGQVIVKKINKK